MNDVIRTSKPLAQRLKERAAIRRMEDRLDDAELFDEAALALATTPETLLQSSDPTSKEAISLDLENVQTQLDVMTRRYERLAAAAKNYVATGSGSSAIYEAMEDEAHELKANADPYKAVCQGGTGGKCCQPDCEICWPDTPPLNGG